jgi:Uma2 family endonuclease
MSTATVPPPKSAVPSVAAPPATPPPACQEPFGGMANLRRFSVDEYHRMIEDGILKEKEPVELLKGFLVLKISRTPQHDGAMDLFEGALTGLVPPTWFLRIQRAIALSDSEPEPDYAIVRGMRRDYLNRHPRPNEVGLLVEISRSRLGKDTTDKIAIYAEAGIPTHWIVDVDGRKIEVHSQPSGTIYAHRADYVVGDSVPLVLDENTVGAVAVADVMA